MTIWVGGSSVSRTGGPCEAVRIEPRWPDYPLSILYLKRWDLEFWRLIGDCDSHAWEDGEAAS
jgi:hypothetical protein